MSVSPRGGVVRIVFSDGSGADLSPETVSRYCIRPGSIIPAETLRSLGDELAYREAERLSLGLLARSRHSRRGLSLKLQRRGYSEPVIRDVIGRLADLGYLDDERAARGWLEGRLERHPEGRLALLAGLERHGVPRDVAERAVEAHLAEHPEEEAARRLLRKLYGTPAGWAALEGGSERARAIRRLLSRGFGRSVARRVLPGEGED